MTTHPDIESTRARLEAGFARFSIAEVTVLFDEIDRLWAEIARLNKEFGIQNQGRGFYVYD